MLVSGVLQMTMLESQFPKQKNELNQVNEMAVSTIIAIFNDLIFKLPQIHVVE